jgi:hypothetical protein
MQPGHWALGDSGSQRIMPAIPRGAAALQPAPFSNPVNGRSAVRLRSSGGELTDEAVKVT